MRFYLDEMYSPAIATLARARGVDVVSSHKGCRDGTIDDDQLLFAAHEQRCVVTENHSHFIQATTRFFEAGYPHAGVLLVPRSLPNDAFAAIAAALIHFDHLHPDGLPPYTILWLSLAPQ